MPPEALLVTTTRSSRCFPIAVAIVMLAAACTSSGDETTTTGAALGSDRGVEFGSGVIPETFPPEFPVPSEAVIGTTLIDHVNNNSEVLLTLPATVLDAGAYFEENLASRGFEITTSEGSDSNWVIEFGGGGGDGVVRINGGGPGVSVVAVQFSAG